MMLQPRRPCGKRGRVPDVLTHRVSFSSSGYDPRGTALIS